MKAMIPADDPDRNYKIMGIKANVLDQERRMMDLRTGMPQGLPTASQR